MNEHSNITRATYDQIAAEYAVKNAAMPPELIGFGAQFLALAGPGARVLDVGCGAGRDMVWLEGHGARVTGVDLAAGMLAQARPLVRGGLAQMDMRGLAFATGQFQGIWCVASLLHLPKDEAPRALAEMRRVLGLGGVLFLGVQEGSGEGWEQAPYDAGARLFARYQADEMGALLRHAGFTVREQGRSQGGIRTWLQFLALAT